MRTAESASEDGVRIQAELTRRNIGIVAIRENIDTREGSAAAKFFRRAIPALGAYQVDSASERIRLGLDRARASGKRVGRPPALSREQAEQCLRMADEGVGLRHIARGDGLLAGQGEEGAGIRDRIGRRSRVPGLTGRWPICSALSGFLVESPGFYALVLQISLSRGVTTSAASRPGVQGKASGGLVPLRQETSV